MLVDQKAREDAVNPNYSCLVNAPAGSGKTALACEYSLDGYLI